MSVTPPFDGVPSGAPFPAEQESPLAPPAHNWFPNFPISEEEQKKIVSTCMEFKKASQSHAREKKDTMRDCYAYTKNKLLDNDLLPVPSVGSQNDANTKRSKVFIPIVRQTVKQLYSYLKLTIFPNDEDYFRVRGKDAEAAQIEDQLTEALKELFKNAKISEKVGLFLYNLVCFGNAAGFPTVREDKTWEWQFDNLSGQYVAIEKANPPVLDFESWNPIDFYIDPNAKDPEIAKWGYYSSKKIQEMLDSDLYMNKDRLRALGSDTANSKRNDETATDLSSYNGLQNQFQDTEKSVNYDLFYFPYIETDTRIFRNMLIGVAGAQALVRFHPNTTKQGRNPAVFCNWTPDVDTLYGTGPIEDIKDLQRLVNIMHNYMVDVLSRIGNRFAATEGVDLTNLFGIAGGVATVPEGGSLTPITGDYTEPNVLQNTIGTLKAEAQVTAGTQTPFQGSSNIDFKKTATEIQVLQENSISVMREVIEHISVMGVQKILESLMYWSADLMQGPMSVRKENAQGQPEFMSVDLSVINTGRFTIELVGVNPSQSKSAQVAGLTELVSAIGENPEGLIITQPIIEKIGELQGIKNVKPLLSEVIQRIEALRGAQQQGIPGQEAGVGIDPQQTVVGPPPTYPQ